MKTAMTVADVAAGAAILSALVTGAYARSAQVRQAEAERIRELETRISERKFDTYKPIIEMFRDLLKPDGATKMAAAAAANNDKLSDFSAWITIYGSGGAVKAWHKFMQAAMNSAPHLIMTRLFADFLIAARKDIGYPHSKVKPSLPLGMRINDLYTDRESREALTLPFSVLCKRQNWTPPWLSRS